MTFKIKYFEFENEAVKGLENVETKWESGLSTERV